MSIAPRPPQIIPYLFYRDVGAALDFLTRAFGFKEEMRHATPSGGVHGEASFQGQLVMLGQGGGGHSQELKPPSEAGAATMGVFIYRDDVDRHYEVATAAGRKSSTRRRMRPTGGTTGRTIPGVTPGSSRARGRRVSAVSHDAAAPPARGRADLSWERAMRANAAQCVIIRRGT